MMLKESAYRNLCFVSTKWNHTIYLQHWNVHGGCSLVLRCQHNPKNSCLCFELSSTRDVNYDDELVRYF